MWGDLGRCGEEEIPPRSEADSRDAQAGAFSHTLLAHPHPSPAHRSSSASRSCTAAPRRQSATCGGTRRAGASSWPCCCSCPQALLPGQSSCLNGSATQAAAARQGREMSSASSARLAQPERRGERGGEGRRRLPPQTRSAPRSYLPISPHISPNLPKSPLISPYLPAGGGRALQPPRRPLPALDRPS